MKTPQEDLDEITGELLKKGFTEVTENLYKEMNLDKRTETRRIETKAGVRFFMKKWEGKGKHGYP